MYIRKKEKKLAKKFCVFCGNTPEKKNMEHVIPQWLSRYTGRYKMYCHQPGVTDKKIPFSELKFPACTACNDYYSDLEGRAKNALIKIMESKPLNAKEINDVLDWFDKVRVGLWLSELTLAHKVDEVAPKFHISQRMGAKDRMLIVERISTDGKGIAYAGTGYEGFYDAPNAFQLIINDYVFTNASEHRLVAPRLGFPCMDKLKYSSEDFVLNDVSAGTCKTKHPVVKGFDASPSRTIIYQPMFKGLYDIQSDNNPYHCDYVAQYSLDAPAGVGGIFYQRGDNTIKYLEPGQNVTISPRAPSKESHLYALTPKVYELQRHIVNNSYDIKTADAQHKKIMEMRQKLIQRYIDFSKAIKSK